MNSFKNTVQNIQVFRNIRERESKRRANESLERFKRFHLVQLYPVIRDLKKPKPERDRANAAALILEFASEQAQEIYQRSPTPQRERMISAVIEDGGLYDGSDHWVDLPALVYDLS